MLKNKKLEKVLLKLAIGAAFTFLMGYTYKTAKEIDEAIDEKYEDKKTDSLEFA